MRPDPPLSSSCMDKIDIILLSSPWETSQRILRHVQKSARDRYSATLHRIRKFSYVEYELQRTIVSNCNRGGWMIPLDIRWCPSNRRIWDDRLDQASWNIFELHGDLKCLCCFLCVLLAFCLFIRKVVSGMVTSTDNITRCDT
jgi:hypothetical protein